MIYEFTRTITWCDVTSLVIRETINCLKVRGPGPGVRLHVSGHVSHAPLVTDSVSLARVLDVRPMSILTPDLWSLRSHAPPSSNIPRNSVYQESGDNRHTGASQTWPLIGQRSHTGLWLANQDSLVTPDSREPGHGISDLFGQYRLVGFIWGSGTVSNSFQQNLGFIVSIQTIFVECRQDQRLSHDYTHTQSQRPALVVKSP